MSLDLRPRITSHVHVCPDGDSIRSRLSPHWPDSGGCVLCDGGSACDTSTCRCACVWRVWPVAVPARARASVTDRCEMVRLSRAGAGALAFRRIAFSMYNIVTSANI